MSTINRRNVVMSPLLNGCEPAQGSKLLMVNLDFSVNTSYEIDLYQDQMDDTLEFCQTLWLDNSLNAAQLIVTLATGQIIRAKALTQGYYSALFGNKLECVITSAAAANLIVPVGFISGQLDAMIWTV